ncbi:MAG: hypothetical protein CXZ00_04475 [Acidobacteria bacterium]|nr:MAG: hypothetical protein CXZ00_04475 [Acidobacteriota bacterium]
MSIFRTIVADVEKFFKATGTSVEKFAVAFWKLFKKAPSALQTVENFVNQVAPVIVAAVMLADSEAEPEVAEVLATIETSLAAVQASATAATSGRSLVANLENLAATVPALLTGVAIKNPSLKASITKIVNLVVGECKVLIPAVESWVAQIKNSTAAAA